MSAEGPYEVDDRHLEQVLAFNDDSRYAYFVARVCDTGHVYGLADADGGWLVWGHEGQDREVFPAWPHPRLAALAAEDVEGVAPEGTDLEEFLRFCDVLEDEGLLVAVMPYPDGSQLVVEPADLKRDLQEHASGAYDDPMG